MIRTLLYVMSLSAFICTGCKEKQRNIFDESDYQLHVLDSSKGFIEKKILIYKYDTARKLEFEYWPTGEIQSKAFTYHDQFDGKLEVYLPGRNTWQIDSYANGNLIYSHNYQSSDTFAGIEASE